MARPIKWTRDLHPIREMVIRSRTETWSRQDVERLFNISRASAQSLMKAIGGIQTVGAAHFVERPFLLQFLNEMIAADSVELALQAKLAVAEPSPRPKALRISLPADLRHVMLPDLPANVKLSPGRIEVSANDAIAMLEALVALAMVMQNDLDRWQQAIQPLIPVRENDGELKAMFSRLRHGYVLRDTDDPQENDMQAVSA